MTSLRISNWLSYGFLGLQVSLTLLWIWECQLTLYFLTFRAELYKISIAIYLMEICFCAGQLGFLSLYGKFNLDPRTWLILAHLKWSSLIFFVGFRYLLMRFFGQPLIFIFILIGMQHRILHDCHSSSIIHLMLHMYRYIDSLRIEYHLLYVVILVKMFANVFSYNPITSSWKEF